MKKFVLEHIGKGERLGLWELSDASCIRTPALWVGTRGGSVPHLTPETVEIGGLDFQNRFAGLLVPFQDHMSQTDVFQEYKKGIFVLTI